VLEVFRDDFRRPVVVCIRPQVRVEPAQLIGCTSSNCVADNRFIRIKNRELEQKLLSFPEGVDKRQDYLAARIGRVTAATNSTIA
jgi:hypothetical protein